MPENEQTPEQQQQQQQDANVPPVSRQTAGGVTGAVIGGAIAGPVGAVLGGLAGVAMGDRSAQGKPLIPTSTVEAAKDVAQTVQEKVASTSIGSALPRSITGSAAN